MRKNVLKYDDVMNRQREVIYRERREVLEGANIKEQVMTFIEDTIRGYVGSATSEGFPEEWDLNQLWTVLKSTYPISFTVEELEKEEAEKARSLLFDKVMPLMTKSSIHQHEHDEGLGHELSDKNRVKPIMFRIKINEKSGRFERQ